MGVWLGPRGKRALVIDLSSFTAKGCIWNGTQWAKASTPTLTYDGGVLNVSISKEWTEVSGLDEAGIAVSGPLDLTKYSKITVDFSALSGNGHVAVYVSTSGTDFVKTRDTNQYDFSDSPVELDLSELPDGTYYFGIAIEAVGQGAYTKSITINSVKATK